MPYTSLTTTTQAGELKLEASQHSDLPGLTNTTNTELRISLSAKGQWCLYNGTIPQYAVFNAKTDWKGMVQLAPSIYANHKWRKAGAPAGCVLAEILDANGFMKDILVAPATIDLPPGHKVVFVINDDVNWYANNSGQISLSYSCKPKDPKVLWGGWESLGGSFISDPKAVSWGKGHLQVFVHGQRKDVCTKGWTGNGYGDWVLLGGQCLNNPSAISWGPGHLETFHIGMNNHQLTNPRLLSN